MSDLLNPHINPYLPSFANQRPRINDVVAPQIPTQPNYSTIHYVNGYEGARGYSLAAGSSEILVESGTLGWLDSQWYSDGRRCLTLNEGEGGVF